MKRSSLKTKMALSISVFFLALVPTSSYYLISYFKEQLKRSLVQQQALLIEREAQGLDNKLALVHELLKGVARGGTPPEIFCNPRAAQRFLDNRLTLKALFDNGVFCFDPAGRLLAETALFPPRVGEDRSRSDYLARTVATGRPVVSAPYLSGQPHHHPAVMFTAPVFTRDGRLAGILGGSLDLLSDNFLGALSSARIGGSGYYYLIDQDRTLIVHPDRSRIMKADAPPGTNRLLDRALAGFQEGGETVNSRGVPMVTSFRRLKNANWLLAVNLPQEEAYALIRQTERGLWSFIALFGVLLSSLVWMTMRRLANPLLLLTRQVSEIGNLERVEVRTGDEIGDLARAFNRQLEVIRGNERTLREERELFQTLADFSSDWVFWRTEREEMRYNSPACLTVSGYAPAELTGESSRMDRLIHPDDRGRWREHAHQADSGGNPLPIEFRILTKSGEQRWVDHICRPIVDRNGRFRGTRGSNRDITERKRAEQSLERSEARFRRFFEHNSSVMLIVDPGRGCIVDANPSAAGFYGYPTERLIGMPLDRIDTHSREELELELQRALHQEHDCGVFEHRLASGELRSVEVHSSPIVDYDRPLLFSIIHDITERKRSEGELRQQEAVLRQEIAERQSAQASLYAQRGELEELNRSLEERIDRAVAELRRKDQVMINQSRQAAMGEMIGNIAHQWRQPLNALGLLLANIKDAFEYRELDQAYLECAIRDGNRLIQKMSSTINDFRNFFNPGKEPVDFAARKQIVEAISLVESSFRNSNVHIRLEAQRDPTLHGFPNEYSQVLLNLVTNARDAILCSGVAQGSIRITLEEREGLGCVTVRDNGGGIPAESLDRIFEPYFSTKEMGTGIGLYMSQMIIERNMHGRIEARNVEGGAEFTILTPLAKETP